MKVQKAKSIVHQFSAANAELTARRAALVRAEQEVERLGNVPMQHETDIKFHEHEIDCIDTRIGVLKAEIARQLLGIAESRKALLDEPREIRAARQHVATCKDRVISQHKVVTRWEKEHLEAKIVIQRVAVNKAAEEAAMSEAKRLCIEELRAAQLAGKVPTDLDIEATVNKTFAKGGIEMAKRVLA